MAGNVSATPLFCAYLGFFIVHMKKVASTMETVNISNNINALYVILPRHNLLHLEASALDDARSALTIAFCGMWLFLLVISKAPGWVMMTR